jgi:hypothetical protein
MDASIESPEMETTETMDIENCIERNCLIAAWSRYKLFQLENGWFDGQGVAPDKQKIEIVAQNIGIHYPETLPMPIIAPTQEGNLLIEWNAEGSPSVDIDLGKMRASFHAFGKTNEDIEKDFTLNNNKDWAQLFAFLSNNIRPLAGAGR